MIAETAGCWRCFKNRSSLTAELDLGQFEDYHLPVFANSDAHYSMDEMISIYRMAAVRLSTRNAGCACR